MTIADLRKQYGMTQQQFAVYFGIPKRTVENWDSGINKCPAYLISLIEYKLAHEKGAVK